MSDYVESNDRYLVKYINGTFAKFYADVLDYFANYLYDRFSWKVIDTFDKAVEYNSKLLQYGYETDKPNRPALAMRPGVPELDSQFSGNLWRFPNLYGKFGANFFEPIYEDSNIKITAPTLRYTGNIDFSALFGSIYELIDFKHVLINIFGGYNRFIYPHGFNGYIILPDEIVGYTYENTAKNISYKLNIPGAKTVLVKTINKNEVVYPFKLKPWFKLISTEDASVRLGGLEEMPDWRLAFTIEYEMEVPSYVILENDFKFGNIDFNIGYGSNYSSNNQYNTDPSDYSDSPYFNGSYGSTNTPDNPYGNSDIISSGDYKKTAEQYKPSYSEYPSYIRESGIDSTRAPGEESNEGEFIFSGLFVDTTNGSIQTEIGENKVKYMKARYVYNATVEDSTSDENVEITLPCKIDNPKLITLISKYGKLSYGDHYIILEDGLSLILIKKNISLTPEQIIELYIYSYSN